MLLLSSRCRLAGVLILWIALFQIGHADEMRREPRVIGINFEGGGRWSDDRRFPGRPLVTEESAGLIAQQRWNNAPAAARTPDSGVLLPIFESSGDRTDMQIYYKSAITYNIGLDEEEGGDYTLMDGYLNTDSEAKTVIEISSIPYLDYFVVVYHDGSNDTVTKHGKYTVIDSQGLRRESISTDSIGEHFSGSFQETGNFYSVFGLVREQSSIQIEAVGIHYNADQLSSDELRAPVNGLQIVDVTNRIDLADIVGGGNGFGTGIVRQLAPGANDTVLMPEESLVEAVFVPRREGVVIGRGNRSYSFESEEASSSIPISNESGEVGNPQHVENAGISFEHFIGMGVGKGITFSLEKLRADQRVGDLTAFTAVLGENRNVSGGSVSCSVLIDGVLVDEQLGLSDSERLLYLDVPVDAKSLTVAITGDSDGLAYLANPFVLFDLPEPSLLSRIFSSRNVFIFLAGVIVITALVFWVMWARGRKQMRHLKRLQAVEAERRRIARDMHDEAGAQLARIAILSDLTQRENIETDELFELVQSIRKTSREAVRRFDQIVWAVNPESDSIPSFVDFLSTYGKGYFSETEIIFLVDAPDDLPDLPLQADVRRSALQVCEEIMSNSLKHSGATQVAVTFSYDRQHLHIEMSDNGSGFSDEDISVNSNGLKNIRHRVESFHGQLMVENDAGKGVMYRFSVPVSN